MALFDELRQQMSAKYGKKKKKEEEEPLLPVAGDSSSAGAKTSFDSMRKNLSKKYNPAADVDTDYIDSFLRDSSDFLKSAETDYNSMTPDTSSQIYASRHKASEDLNKRRNAIKSFLEQNRDRLDPKAYGDLTKYLDDFAGASGQLGYAFYDANRQMNMTEYDVLASFDMDAGKKELDDLAKKKAALEEEVYKIGHASPVDDAWTYNAPFRDYSGVEDSVSKVRELKAQISDIEKQYSEKEAYYNRAKQIQAGAKLAVDAVNSIDFNKYLQKGMAVKNPDFNDALGSTFSGAEDVINKVEFVKANETELMTLIAQGVRAGGRTKVEGLGEFGNSDWINLILNMNNKQRSIYNYYIGKGEADKADEYLKSLQEGLREKVGGQIYSQLEGNIPGELAFGALAGIDQYLSGVSNLFSDEDYIVPTSTQMASGMAREDLATAGPKVFGNSLGQWGYDTITTVSNMLPSIAISYLTAGAASGLGASAKVASKVGKISGNIALGVSSAGHEYADKLNSGMNKDQARAIGIIQGVWEGASEYFLGSIGGLGSNKIGKLLGKTGFAKGLEKAAKGTVKGIIDFFGDAASEGLEEVIQDIGSSVINGIMTEKWEFSSLEEQAYNFTLGALTAATMNSPGKVSDIVRKRTSGGAGLKKSDLKAIEGKLDGMIADPEFDGDTKKLLEAVREDIKSGKIDTDKIEQIFGGDKYTAWKDADRKESELIEEYEKLADTPSMELTRNQQKRLDELEGQLENLRGKTESNRLYGELTGYVSEQINNSKLKDSKLNDIYNDKVSRRTKFTADVSKYSSEAARRSIQNLIDTGYANNSKETHEFADNVAKLAERTGKVFSFVNDEQIREMGKAVEGRRVNGFVTEDGIAVNLDSRKAWEFIVGHEVTHVIEGLNSYTELHDALKEYATQRGEWDSRLKELTELYEGQDADVEAELVADLVGEYLFGDTDFISSLAAKNPNVFQKIYAAIKHLLKTVTAGSKQARQLERAKYAFEKAMRESGKAKVDGTEYSLSGEVKNLIPANNVNKNEIAEAYGGDGDVKYSLSKDNVTESQQFVRWFGDWKNNSKNASKIVNADGTPKIVYHQTDRDFTVFDNSTPVAGKNDSETPNGFFFKDNDHDIGIGGSKQMAVYLDMKNPLRFASREDANQWYCQNISGYASLQNEMNEALSPISTEMDNIENEMFSDEVTDEQYEILDQKWNELLDKMKSVENDFRGRLRKLLDDYFINGSSGYDGIILDYDGHRYVNGVREDVKTYIVFKRTQIKSATDNIGTYDGSNPDINYSLSYENEADANADKRLNNADDTVPVREDANVQDTDRMPPVREDVQAEAETAAVPTPEAAEATPITTVGERLSAKKGNYETELEANKANRKQAWANYDDAIAQAQAQYDDLKNKDTKKANNLLRRIDRLKRQQANVDADYEKRISDLESRIGRTSEKIELNEQRKAQLASDIASLNMPTQERKSSDKIAKSLTKESGVNQKKKKRGILSLVKEYVLDNGMVFEDKAKETQNRQLEAKWNSIRYARGMAQRFLKKGVNGARSIVDLEAEVTKKGLTQDFYDYMHHMLNVDRMSLESKAQAKIADIIANNPVLGTLLSRNQSTGDILNDPLFKQNADTLKADVDKILKLKETKNHPVFGDPITSEISAEEAAKLEKAHPEFKSYAEEIYANNRELRNMLVEEGIITPETAELWEEMYPHYVPLRRAKKRGGGEEYGRHMGVNAPLKRAKGGNTDIEPLFNTIALRAEQTYKAVLKNRFGVELKNTIQTPIVEADNNLGGKIDTPDGVENIDSLLMPGDDNHNPTFTVFENGKKVTFEITEEMYDAMRPAGAGFSYTSKTLNTISNLMRGLLTEYNPVFTVKNFLKDVQDVIMNSQHPAETYAAIPKAVEEMKDNGRYYNEYLDNGGEQNSYFDDELMVFDKPNIPLEVIKTITGLNAISKANRVTEMTPRLAEYIASREAGRSIEVSMLDAARVTTNFAAGGKLTKLLNRNGFTFLNASVQGFTQNVRNIREAKMNGLRGWVALAAKTLVLGAPALLLNNLIWDDDEEYEELSDYVKQNYYIVGKFGDGKFVRIPKGRVAAVIQDAFTQMENVVTGDDELDMRSFVQLVIDNLAPNNPFNNNVAAPIFQVLNNTTWYNDDLVPTRLQDVPAGEQYDETTDMLSKWLGEKLDISPYKLNYLLDQYTGGIGDILLPMITPESETGNDSFIDYATAPFRDQFTTDSVLKNQNVSDFYDLKDELNVNANSSKATDDDVLKNKYMNSMSDRISELQKQKREIQARNDLSKSEKYDMTRDLQKEIVALTKEAIDSYENLNQVDDNHTEIGGYYYEWYTPEEGEPYWRKMTDSQKTKYLLTKDADGHYVTDGNVHYRLDEDGEWTKISDKDLARQNEVTKELGITPDEYWSKTETSFFPVKSGEYEYAYENPENYTVAKAVGGYDSYKSYSKDLSGIKADKDESGKSISGSRKEKVLDYINGLDIDYGEKIILFKNEYNADDTYNYDIINYLNSRDDISYSEMETILKELGFDVDSEGNVSW